MKNLKISYIQVMTMVTVFIICWGPYATLSIFGVLGFSKVKLFGNNFHSLIILPEGYWILILTLDLTQSRFLWVDLVTGVGGGGGGWWWGFLIKNVQSFTFCCCCTFPFFRQWQFHKLNVLIDSIIFKMEDFHFLAVHLKMLFSSKWLS